MRYSFYDSDCPKCLRALEHTIQEHDAAVQLAVADADPDRMADGSSYYDSLDTPPRLVPVERGCFDPSTPFPAEPTLCDVCGELHDRAGWAYYLDQRYDGPGEPRDHSDAGYRREMKDAGRRVEL